MKQSFIHQAGYNFLYRVVWTYYYTKMHKVKVAQRTLMMESELAVLYIINDYLTLCNEALFSEGSGDQKSEADAQ